MLKICSLVLAAVISASSFAFGQDPAATVVAKIDSTMITQQELDDRVREFNLLVDNSLTLNALTDKDAQVLKISSVEQKEVFLKDKLIYEVLFFQEALRRKLDENPEVKDLLVSQPETKKRAILSYRLLNDEISGIEVTTEEIEQAYNSNNALFREPEQRQVRELVVKTEDEAKELYIKLLKGLDFAALAKKYSLAPSAASGGDLGFLSKDAPAPVGAVAFGEYLEEGKLSQIFRVPEGFCVLKLEAKRGGKIIPLAEIYDQLKYFLLSAKQQEKIAALRFKLANEAKIEVYEDRIK